MPLVFEVVVFSIAVISWIEPIGGRQMGGGWGRWGAVGVLK